MQSQRNLFTAALASAMLFPCSVFAADDDTIVVTATRTAQTIDDSLASVSVITQADIERSQAQNLAQLLRNIPGINIIVNGGMGKTSSLQIRGGNEAHTLLLIDGVRMGSATSGSLPIADISIGEIDRIEIVRGPRTSLYGSDAIGGVVQIFTKAYNKTQGSEASLRYGSYATTEFGAGTRWGSDKLNYSLQASGLNTAGFDAYNGNNPDADGYTRNSVNFGLHYRLNETGELSLSSLQVSGDNQYDSYNMFRTALQNQTDVYTNTYSQSANNIKLDTKISDRWQSIINLSNSSDHYQDYLNGTDNGLFVTNRNQLTWQNDIAFNDNNLTTLGVDYLDEAVSGSTAYTVSQRNNSAVFAQNQWQGNRTDLLMALRSDASDSYGQNTTGNLSFGVRHNGLHSFIAAGTAFHAPSFNDLYWPSAGNPNLKPETAQNLELGTGHKGKRVSWSLNLYQNDVSNLIAWAPVDPLNPSGSWQPSNINTASITGLEWMLNTRIGRWNTGFGIDLTDARDTATGNLLPRRPGQVIRFNINGQVMGVDLGLDAKQVGESFDDVYNTTTNAAYTLVDITMARKIGKRWLISGRIDNALDVPYQTAAGYNSPRRSFSLGVKYKMDH